jgi:hypothetical protein
MKVKHDFPNGKSRGYLRINGQFFANKRFSKGDFDDNSLNIGQLDVFFTFVFWFNLEKMPENREFHPKITGYAIQAQNKNPGNTPMGMLPGFLPLYDGSNWQQVPTDRK